jgi:hypothetical protein
MVSRQVLDPTRTFATCYETKTPVALILKTGRRACYRRSPLRLPNARRSHTPPQAIAQRFSAMALRVDIGISAFPPLIGRFLDRNLRLIGPKVMVDRGKRTQGPRLSVREADRLLIIDCIARSDKAPQRLEQLPSVDQQGRSWRSAEPFAACTTSLARCRWTLVSG